MHPLAHIAVTLLGIAASAKKLDVMRSIVSAFGDRDHVVDLELGVLAAPRATTTLFFHEQGDVIGREMGTDNVTLASTTSVLYSRLTGARLLGVGVAPSSDGLLNLLLVLAAVFLQLGLVGLAVLLHPGQSGWTIMVVGIILPPMFLMSLNFLWISLSPSPSGDLLALFASIGFLMLVAGLFYPVRVSFGPIHGLFASRSRKFWVGSGSRSDVGSIGNTSAFAARIANYISFRNVPIFAWFTGKVSCQATFFRAGSADLFHPFLRLREGSL